MAEYGMEWKHPQLPCKKKFKPNHSQENYCLHCFGTRKALYWDIIKRRAQQQTVCGTVRCLLTGWSLQFEANAEDYCWNVLCCCTTLPIRILLTTLLKHSGNSKFEVMAHPLYTPDLAPSNYLLFGPLNEALRCRWFTSDQEVKEAVHAWFAAQPKTFFWRALGSLCNDGPSELKSKGTMLKNYVIVSFLFVLQ